MRTRFELEEDDRYEAAKELLIRRCLSWATRQEREADPFVLALALDSRHLSVDGRLSWWTPEQVRRFLLDWLPGRTAADPDDLLHAPQSLQVLIDYLDAVGLLDPRGASAAVNTAAIEKAAAEFPEALRDPMRQSIGGFWTRTALANGVDLTDQEALQRFTVDAQEGRIDFDRELLDRLTAARFSDESGELDDLDEPDGGRAFAQPPVALPAEDELAEAAEQSTVVRQLRGLAEWAGKAGRPLTANGYLRMPDARELVELLGTGDEVAGVRSSGQLPGLNQILTWAKSVRVIRVSKGRVHAVAKAAPLLADPLALWHRAFDTVFELGDVICRSLWQRGGTSMMYDVFPELLEDVLNTVYGMEHPVPVRRLEESAWLACDVFSFDSSYGPELDLPPLGEPEGPSQPSRSPVFAGWADSERRHVSADLVRALRALEALGAVEITEGVAHPTYSMDLTDPADADDDAAYEPDAAHGRPDADVHGPGADLPAGMRSPFPPEATRRLREDLREPGLLVRLTSLGAAAMRKRMVAQGREAGLVGELVDAPPAGLLGVLVDHYDQAGARTEIEGWLAAHGGDIEPLLDAVRACPFRTRAAMMLDLLIEVLPEVASRLPELRSDSALGPIVITRQIEEGVLQREELTLEQGMLGMAESLLGFMETASLDAMRDQLAEIAAVGDLRALADDVLACGHPATEAMEELRALLLEELSSRRPPALHAVGSRRRSSAPGAKGRPTGRGKKGKKGRKR